MIKFNSKLFNGNLRKLLLAPWLTNPPLLWMFLWDKPFKTRASLWKIHCKRCLTSWLDTFYERRITTQSKIPACVVCVLLCKQRPVMRYSCPRVRVIWAVLFNGAVNITNRLLGEKHTLNEEWCCSIANEPQQAKLAAEFLIWAVWHYNISCWM